MHAKKEINLLEGRILPTLVRLAMPIMASSFVGLAYTLTDMFWVAGLGDRAVAAVGSAGTMLWFVDNLFSIPRVGGQVLVGQSLGAGRPDEARMWTRAALRLGYVMAFVATLIFVSMSGVLTSIYRFNDAETIIRTERYIRIVSIGLIPNVGVRLYNAVLTASGNSFTPFVIYVTGLGVNMVLDPLFILVFKWDVVGAAIATVVAETVAYVLMLIAIRRTELFFEFAAFPRAYSSSASETDSETRGADLRSRRDARYGDDFDFAADRKVRGSRRSGSTARSPNRVFRG